jgi:hypothetical protein
VAVRRETPASSRPIAEADQRGVRERLFLIPLAAAPLAVLLVLVALVAPAVAQA